MASVVAFDNVRFKEHDCNELQLEMICTHPEVYNWCKWNSELSICQNNYEPVLFISPWDPTAISKSAIGLLYLIAAVSLYWISGQITRKLKIFQRVDSDKLDKCKIYVFELIGLTIAMIYLLYSGTFNAIFFPQDYANIEPEHAHHLAQSLSVCIFVTYMVCNTHVYTRTYHSVVCLYN